MVWGEGCERPVARHRRTTCVFGAVPKGRCGRRPGPHARRPRPASCRPSRLRSSPWMVRNRQGDGDHYEVGIVSRSVCGAPSVARSWHWPFVATCPTLPHRSADRPNPTIRRCSPVRSRSDGPVMESHAKSPSLGRRTADMNARTPTYVVMAYPSDPIVGMESSPRKRSPTHYRSSRNAMNGFDGRIELPSRSPIKYCYFPLIEPRISSVRSTE